MTVANDHAVIAEAREYRNRWFHHAMVARRAEQVIPSIPRVTRVVHVDGRWTKTRRRFERIEAAARGFLNTTDRVVID